MPLNIPSGTTNDISFGPARVFFGEPSPNASGSSVAAPSTDVGFIGEDGVSIELGQEVRNIRQGNPALISYSFYTQQSATISFNSIEWDFSNFSKAVGGTYDSSGTPNNFGFGGRALSETLGIKIQHQMAVTSNTMDIYVYQAQSESNLNFSLGQEEHQFPMSFSAISTQYDFDGNPLDASENLVSFRRVT